jgi:hypothetical protein
VLVGRINEKKKLRFFKYKLEKKFHCKKNMRINFRKDMMMIYPKICVWRKLNGRFNEG